MKMFRRMPLLFVLLALVAVTAFGQGTTANLSGEVTTGGSALPGATVTISSPSMQGVRTTVTSENGTYNFPSIPPGEYTLTVALEGMNTVTRKVTASLAQSARADVDLRLSTLSEAITVTAGASAVLETSQVSSNFTSKEIDELPVERTIRGTVLLSPGVNSNGPGNQIMISGAPSSDNVFLVNGVVVNENLRGQPHNLFIEDAIAETTILTGGISAEYGRFTGGVVSTLTKSGGNEFSGSLRDSFSNPDWTDETPFVNPTNGLPQAQNPDKLVQTFEATLGGYLLRDRLWFFGAGRQAKGPTAGNVSSTRTTFQTGISYENTVDETRYEGKLTGQITSKHTVVGSYLDVKLDESNNAFTPIYDEASIVTTRSLPNTLMSISYNGILTSNLLVEGQYAQKDFAFVGSGGQFTDRIRGTWIQSNATGGRMNAPVFCGVCTDEGRNNESWLVKGTYFLSTGALGTHNVIMGVENFAEERIANNYQSGSQYQITTGQIRVAGTQAYPIFDSTTRIVWRPIFVSSPGTDFQTSSVFFNDKWDLNQHLSFNLGVRYDKNDGKDASGNTVSDDSAFSPRLGLIYDLTGNGRNRFNISYGKYVAKIADGNVGGGAQAAGNPAFFQWRYTGPNINSATGDASALVNAQEALRLLFENFDSQGGTDNRTNLLQTSIPGLSTRFNEPISSPSVDEITLGFGSQLTNTAFAKVDLIARDWSDFYAARLNQNTGKSLDDFGNRGDVGEIINDNDTKREYRGAQLQFAWRPSRFNLGGGYTWSTLKGTDEGEQAGTATVPNQTLALYYPEFMGYANRLPEGYISGDQRHRARVWAGYDLPTFLGNFNLSVLQTYNSGAAYSGVGLINPRSADPLVGAPAICSATVTTNCLNYTRSQLTTTASYFFSDRGEFRTADSTATDVALNYNLPLFGKFQIYAGADVTNVFNEDAIVDLSASRTNTTVRTATTHTTAGLAQFNPFTTAPIECPQGAPAATCTSMGAHYQLDPRFGMANNSDAYQTPLTYRVTAGIRF